MKKVTGISFVLLLAVFFLADLTCAESHRMKIVVAASINGIQLKPGQYSVKLNGTDAAEIYRGGKLLVTANCKLVSLGGAVPNSIAQAEDGQLKEIRFKKDRIVFLDSPDRVRVQR